MININNTKKLYSIRGIIHENSVILMDCYTIGRIFRNKWKKKHKKSNKIISVMWSKIEIIVN